MFEYTEEDRDERNACAHIICQVLNVKTLDVTTSIYQIQEYTFPIETIYTIKHYKTTDTIDIKLHIYITPTGRIIIKITSGCWIRLFEIHHPNTFKRLVDKLQRYDFWNLNKILSKPVTISSFT